MKKALVPQRLIFFSVRCNRRTAWRCHEVLGFFAGSTPLLFGGENGHRVNVGRGDVLIIPAGVAHKNLGAENQVKCIGAYPDGRDYDINTGQPGERPGTLRNIAALPIPSRDPLYGAGEGLPKIWERILNPPV